MTSPVPAALPRSSAVLDSGPTHPVVPVLDKATLDSVVATVLGNNDGMALTMAQRIVREAVAFVVTGALRPTQAMAPSRIVDEGWHALVLHTKVYAELCGRFGRFVHHSPGFDPDNFDPDILERTQEAIKAAGFDVDEELWRAPGDEDLVSVAANCQHAPSCSIKPMKKPEKPCTKPAGL
ncbi:hypothetical protein [Kitasatospora xanthocidica]|uniref:glycine-rich domain-containing protein n=1 Tax=Kitasatospora xanthocidica TaxID=83382 RepID=UPI00216AB7D0|nr:hypothetical protein [Kitasatospora xanthocidica]